MRCTFNLKQALLEQIEDFYSVPPSNHRLLVVSEEPLGLWMPSEALQKRPLLYFPSWAKGIEETYRFSDPTSSIRMACLKELASAKTPNLIVATAGGLLQKSCPYTLSKKLFLGIKLNQTSTLQSSLTDLKGAGYRPWLTPKNHHPGAGFFWVDGTTRIHVTHLDTGVHFVWTLIGGRVASINWRRAEEQAAHFWKPTQEAWLGRTQENLSFLGQTGISNQEQSFWQQQSWWRWRDRVSNPNYWLPRLFEKPLSSLLEWVEPRRCEVRYLGDALQAGEALIAQNGQALKGFRSRLPLDLRRHWPDFQDFWITLEEWKQMTTREKAPELSRKSLTKVAPPPLPLVTRSPPRPPCASLSMTLAQAAPFFPGDYLVHREHGIGRYWGLQKGLPPRDEDEYCLLEYAANSKLYVPAWDVQALHFYRSACEGEVELDRLGAAGWSQRREKALKQAKDEAALLLETYLQSQRMPAEAYPLDQVAYEAFCKSFPHSETPDQSKAIQEVLEDLMLPRRMDRLLCGEVGFGKTEVAMRAAFVVAQAKRQVAILTPTTLLAQQNFERFQKRFAPFGFKVAMISRFVDAPTLERIRKELISGEVQVVVGTIQMLQPRFQFKALGLLVVDEEHRLGVAQKELLPNLPSRVKRLSLTASPIPRTLSLALMGLKSLSLMASAPRERKPVKVQIGPFDEEVAFQAIQNELAQGGQVYFVHATIAELEASLLMLNKRFPSARVLMAHGALPPQELEAKMLLFYEGAYDVLVCSSIIEIGLDVRNANTLLVKQVERFGLAQLHQLRGRVGRSDRQGHAYFFYNADREMKQRVQRRLEALERYQGFGAGYLLAEQDLELRGAGEVLGMAQSGKKRGVGISLYHELLREMAFEGGEALHLEPLAAVHAGYGVEDFELGLPQAWSLSLIPRVEERLRYYRGLAACVKEDDFHLLRERIELEHGPMDPRSQLFWQGMLLRYWAKQAKVKGLLYPKSRAQLVFWQTPPCLPEGLSTEIGFQGVKIEVGSNRWSWTTPDWSTARKLESLERLLRFIHQVERAKLEKARA